MAIWQVHRPVMLRAYRYQKRCPAIMPMARSMYTNRARDQYISGKSSPVTKRIVPPGVMNSQGLSRMMSVNCFLVVFSHRNREEASSRSRKVFPGKKYVISKKVAAIPIPTKMKETTQRRRPTDLTVSFKGAIVRSSQTREFRSYL